MCVNTTPSARKNGWREVMGQEKAAIRKDLAQLSCRTPALGFASVPSKGSKGHLGVAQAFVPSSEGCACVCACVCVNPAAATEALLAGGV